MSTLVALLMGLFVATIVLLFSNALAPRPTLQERIEKLFNQTRDTGTSVVLDSSKKRKGIYDIISERLEGSGIQIKANELLFIALMSSFFILVLLWSITGNFLFSFVLGIASFVGVPYFVVETRRRRRLQNIDEQLAEALTIMASALRGGQSVQQALLMMEQQMDPPISEEWARVNHDLKLGEPFDKAMLNFKRRIPSPDVDMFVSSLLISRQLGGDLAEVLDNISGTIQDRISLKREILAQTAMARTSSTVLSFAPVVVFVLLFIVNPGYVDRFLSHPLGSILLIIATILNLVGARVAKRLVKIDELEVSIKN